MDALNLRTNHLQEGGDDGRAPYRGPIIRAMVRRIREEWNSIEIEKREVLIYFGALM